MNHDFYVDFENKSKIFIWVSIVDHVHWSDRPHGFRNFIRLLSAFNYDHLTPWFNCPDYTVLCILLVSPTVVVQWLSNETAHTSECVKEVHWSKVGTSWDMRENFLCSSSSCSPSTLAGCKALRSLPFGKKTSMQLFLSLSISSRSGLVNVNANHRNEHLYFREKYSSVGWKQTKAKTSLCTQDSRIPWKMRTHTQEMPLCFKIKHIFATVRPKACGTAPNTSVDDLLNKQN